MTSSDARVVSAKITSARSARIRRTLTRATLLFGGAGLVLAACSADDSTNTSPLNGTSGSNSAGSSGSSSATAGSGGGSAGTGIGTGGMSGSVGTGGAAGSAGSSGSAGTAGTGGAGPDGGAEAAGPCPGAGMSLHFSDDLAGSHTKSMKVLVDVGADLPIANAARTVEFWAYFEGAESWKGEHSLTEWGTGGHCNVFGIDGSSMGVMDPYTNNAGYCHGDEDPARIMPVPPATGWLHLGWVYDPAGKLPDGSSGDSFMFTVNGVAQNIPSKKETVMLTTTSSKVSIGSASQFGTDDGFTGKIDEYRIWKVARTEKQIADNYKLILNAANEPDLVANYHFDEGTGTDVKDATSKHHDGAFDTANGRPPPTWVASDGLTLTCK